MKPISSSDILAGFSWRYACKKFDSTRKIPSDTWSAIEQAMVLTPSSYGIQPWRFVVVNDAAVRAKLRPVSWNQPQITDASHLVVFCRRSTLTPADIEHYLERIASLRGVTRDSLKDYAGMMLGSVASPQKLPGGSFETYTRSQVYIALGFFLSTCALLGVDACPMEGFDPAMYDEILDLPAQGYHACVLGTAGYRASADVLAGLPKVRFPASEVIRHV